jgi:hypothetical protein
MLSKTTWALAGALGAAEAMRRPDGQARSPNSISFSTASFSAPSENS